MNGRNYAITLNYIGLTIIFFENGSTKFDEALFH